ncbi:MAG: Ger(x)C family spore germination protein [bacterium]|nr:Ger(x)C family spore germination protein [bacterium]
MAALPGAGDRPALSLRVALAVALAVLLPLSAAGCWDLEELDDLALVVALGLDTAGPGEIEAVFQIAVPRNLVASPGGGGGGGAGGSGGGPGMDGYETVSVRARDLTEAMAILTTNYARRPTLIHNELLVLGEELARQGVATLLGSLKDLPEFRGNVVAVVARGRASDLLTIRPLVDPRPSRYLEGLVRQNNAAGQGLVTRVTDILLALDSRSLAPLLPLLERQEAGPTGPDPRILAGAPSKARLVGAAAFRGDAMVGELDLEETRLTLMLRGEGRDGTFTLPDPRDPRRPVSVRISRSRPLIGARRPAGGPVEIDVTLRLEAEVVEIGGPHLTSAGRETFRELARGLEAWLTPRLDDLVRRSQEELRADSFGFGRRVRRTFATLPQWERFAWEKQYPGATVRVRTEVVFRQDGLLYWLPAPP